MQRSGNIIVFSALALSFALSIRAEEGMWTFDNPPLKQLKDKYNFVPIKPGWTMSAFRACA